MLSVVLSSSEDSTTALEGPQNPDSSLGPNVGDLGSWSRQVMALRSSCRRSLHRGAQKHPRPRKRRIQVPFPLCAMGSGPIQVRAGQSTAARSLNRRSEESLRLARHEMWGAETLRGWPTEQRQTPTWPSPVQALRPYLPAYKPGCPSSDGSCVLTTAARLRGSCRIKV